MIDSIKHFSTYLFKHNLQHLILHVTNNCNFRCQHCFIDFSPKKDLKLEEYQKLGKDVGDLFWLDIAGGEPFLRNDLAQIIASFNAKVIQIPSNGSLPERMRKQITLLRQLTKAEIVISLSIDGLEERHDKIRKQKGSYKQLWQTFDILKQMGVSIKINTVLNQENAEEIIELMEEVRAKSPQFHSIILLRGEPLNPTYGLPSYEKLEELRPKIFSIWKTYNYGKTGLIAKILSKYHQYLWNSSILTLKEKTQIIPCLAGSAHSVVWGDGKVSCCEMLESVGSIKEKSWQEIIKSETYQTQLQSIKNKECFCTHNCAMFDSVFFNPTQIFKLLG